MDRLQTFGSVRSIDVPGRRVTSVVSTGDVARDGAIIDTAGWDLTHYLRNPVVLWAHDDRSLPIARTVETQRTDHELIQVHEFATHPRAEEVWGAVRDGFVNATSVRWIPGETEVRSIGEGKAKRQVVVYTRGHQLLESSYVPLPADPGAVVLRADGSPIDPRDYQRQAEPTTIARQLQSEVFEAVTDCVEEWIEDGNISVDEAAQIAGLIPGMLRALESGLGDLGAREVPGDDDDMGPMMAALAATTGNARINALAAAIERGTQILRGAA